MQLGTFCRRLVPRDSPERQESEGSVSLGVAPETGPVGSSIVKASEVQDLWKVLQNDLATHLNLAFQVYSVTGQRRDVFGPANHIPPLTRNLFERVDSCQHCVPATLARQTKRNQPFIYRCPVGLYQCAIPVSSHEEVEDLLVVGEAPSAACSLQEVEKFNRIGLSQTTAMGVPLEGAVIPPFVSHVMDQLSPILVHASQFVKHTQEERVQLKQVVTILSTFMQVAKRSMEVTSTGEIEGLLLYTLGVLYNTPLSSLLLLDVSGEHFVTAGSLVPEGHPLRSYRCPADQVFIKELGNSRRTVYCDDIHRLLKSGYGEGITSVYLFSLPAGGSIKRVVQIFNCWLTPEEIAVIEAFCRQVAGSLERLDFREEVERKSRELNRVEELVSLWGEMLELEKLLRLVLDKCMEIVEAEQGSLMILEEETTELLIKAIRGLDERIVEHFRVKPGEGVAGQVFVTGTPVLVNDIESDERFHHVNRPRYKTASFMSIPLRLKNRALGVINVADKKNGKPFTPEDLRLLCSCGTHASVAIERSIHYEKSKALRQISITDALTGLLNRRYFQERLTEEIDRAKRHHHQLSLIMLDLDNFKEFNDTHGHLAGDDALRASAQIVRNNVRAIDVVARFGGEELSVILPETGKEEATLIAQRIRREIEKGFLFHGITRLAGSLTMSLGVATFPEDAQNLTALIHNSDRALYTAKARGKNCVVVFRENAATDALF